MKKLAVFLLAVGVMIGIGQAFIVYNKTYSSSKQIQAGALCKALIPECGVCLDEVVGDSCVRSEIKPVRGFPFSSAGSGVNWQTNQPLGWQHVINFLIFLLPGAVFFLAAQASQRQNHNRKTK